MPLSIWNHKQLLRFKLRSSGAACPLRRAGGAGERAEPLRTRPRTRPAAAAQHAVRLPPAPRCGVRRKDQEEPAPELRILTRRRLGDAIPHVNAALVCFWAAEGGLIMAQ